MKNSEKQRPVVSFRVERELIERFRAICYEAGEIEQSKAMASLLKYFTMPGNIEIAKIIIREA